MLPSHRFNHLHRPVDVDFPRSPAAQLARRRSAEYGTHLRGHHHAVIVPGGNACETGDPVELRASDEQAVHHGDPAGCADGRRCGLVEETDAVIQPLWLVGEFR